MMRQTLLLAAALSLVACSKKTDDKPSGDPKTEANAAPVGVDICSFASKAKVEEALGMKLTGEPYATGKPTPALLGQCTYPTEAGTADVLARPARHYDPNVKEQPTTAIVGLGEAAVRTEDGMIYVKPAGKPYFLSLSLSKPSGADAAKLEALAKLLVANAK